MIFIQTRYPQRHKGTQYTFLNKILKQDNLSFKLQITVKLNNLVHHSLSLAPRNITAQCLFHPFKTTEFIYKNDKYSKKNTWIFNIL